MARIRTRLLAWSMVAAVGGAVPAFAQAPASDPLAAAKALRQIADQKAEAEVREAVRAAEGVAKASPATAVRNLQKAMLGLDLSAEISPSKRKELIGRLHDAITAVQKPAPVPAVDPKAAKIREDARKTFEGYVVEAKAVRDGIAEIETLSAAGDSAGAQKKLVELIRKHPNNPAVLVLVEQGTWRDRIAAAKAYAKEQDRRLNANAMEVANSALPPRGDIEFPAKEKWDKLTAARLKEEKVDPATEAILKALDKPVQKGSELPFEESVQQLSTLIDLPLYLDKKSLEDAGLDMKRPVTMPGNVRARTALRAVLQSNGLTYIIKDGVIQVVTVEQASKTLVTRAYHMGDAMLGGPFSGAVRFGPALDYEQTMKNAEFMIDAIKKSVEPDIWSDGRSRGPASIYFHYPSLSIIVRAPTEVHAALAGKLR